MESAQKLTSAEDDFAMVFIPAGKMSVAVVRREVRPGTGAGRRYRAVDGQSTGISR